MWRSLCLLAVLSLQGQDTIQLKPGARPGKASLADIAWLAGQWQGTGLGARVEETWSPAAGGSMLGMFRALHDDKPSFYELITITEEHESLIMRLKHFHSDMKGWEEKDRTVDFRLVRLNAKGAWFEGISYLREGPDAMSVVVRIQQKDGKSREEKFSFRRVSSLSPLR